MPRSLLNEGAVVFPLLLHPPRNWGITLCCSNSLLYTANCLSICWSRYEAHRQWRLSSKSVPIRESRCEYVRNVCFDGSSVGEKAMDICTCSSAIAMADTCFASNSPSPTNGGDGVGGGANHGTVTKNDKRKKQERLGQGQRRKKWAARWGNSAGNHLLSEIQQWVAGWTVHHYFDSSQGRTTTVNKMDRRQRPNKDVLLLRLLEKVRMICS